MDTYKLNAWRGNSERLKTDTRTFSLADFADAKAHPIMDPKNLVEKTTLKEDVFYEGMKIDPNSTNEFFAVIQVCDKFNMIAGGKELPTDVDTSFSTHSLGFNLSLQDVDRIENGGLPTEPGDYRIDGYHYNKGKWLLTNRIDKITFTK